MKTLKSIALAATALALFGSTSVVAQSPPRVKQACMADVQRMCPNATPGHGMVMQCIRDRMGEVSADCRTAVAAAKARRAAQKAATASAPPGGAAPAPSPVAPSAH